MRKELTEMLNSINVMELLKLPDMMSISNNILHKDEVAKTLKFTEAAMKQLRETAYNNL